MHLPGQSSAAHIGIIGSRRKTNRVLKAMGAQGVEPGSLARVHAPVGLGIGAKTLKETDVSIVGQIIAVMHGKA